MGSKQHEDEKLIFESQLCKYGIHVSIESLFFLNEKCYKKAVCILMLLIFPHADAYFAEEPFVLIVSKHFITI